MDHAAAFLLIQHAPDALQEVRLDGAPIVIGRAETCDITLAGRLISRQHARISRAAGGYLLEDLGSRNGTQVNGRPLEGSHVLQNGDVIECGGSASIRFVDNDATSTRAQAPARGVWLDQDTEDVWVDGSCLAPPVSSVQFALLRFLDAHRDQICTRAAIIAAVWPDVQEEGISDEAIDALVKRVRSRLGEVEQGQRYLATVRGRGLMLQSPAKAGRR
ncbi:MAG TPA: FHA domain-containing protein [Herpetosiphonaceae bacterium]|nr:FHA domain-containing protein [Herpetosiphonaceae bacterium]